MNCLVVIKMICQILVVWLRRDPNFCEHYYIHVNKCNLELD